MIPSNIARKKYDTDAQTYHKMMYWFRYASTLQQLIWQIPFELPKNGHILELGCGTGIGTEIIIRRFPSASITGLDQSESMLSICRERLPQLELVLGDFNQKECYNAFPEKKPIALQTNSYDLVFTTGAVSEYADLQQVVPFVYDLLKPGGQYVNIGIKRNFVGKIMGVLWKFNPAGKKKLMSVCKQAGFSVNEVPVSWKFFPTTYVKYVVVATKPNII